MQVLLAEYFLLENRSSIWEELNLAPDNVKKYLKDVCKELLSITYFREWIDVHAGFGSRYFIYYQ